MPSPNTPRPKQTLTDEEKRKLLRKMAMGSFFLVVMQFALGAAVVLGVYTSSGDVTTTIIAGVAVGGLVLYYTLKPYFGSNKK